MPLLASRRLVPPREPHAHEAPAPGSGPTRDRGTGQPRQRLGRLVARGLTAFPALVFLLAAAPGAGAQTPSQGTMGGDPAARPGALAPSDRLIPQQATSDGVEVQFLAGRTLYERSEYCGLYDFFLSSADLTFRRGALGVSVTAVLDYPWPLPPPDTFAYVDRGEAVQASVAVYPLQLMESTRELDAFVRPFVAAGVMVSRDGEIRESRGGSYNDETPDGPVYGIRGSVNPALSVGATLALPVGTLLGNRAASLVVDLRRTTLYGVDGEAEGPQGDLILYESQELSWNEIRVGLRLGRGLR